MCFKLQQINIQIKKKATTHLECDEVLSREGLISQQIFKTLGLNVELLNSLQVQNQTRTTIYLSPAAAQRM